MSYLPDHYRAVNREAGHDYNCGFGAGADCYCSVYTRQIETLRAEYRALKATTTLSWADFNESVRALIDFPEWQPDADELAAMYVRAAKKVSAFGVRVVNVA